VLVLGGIYRAKGVEASLLLRIGSRVLLPCHGARLAGRARLPRSLIMRMRGASGFGRARGMEELMKKEENN
jgi:hypothetical protein